MASSRFRLAAFSLVLSDLMFTLAPILFPTELRATASGFAAGIAKIGATVGVFVLPILKGSFGVPAVLGMMAAVSLLGLVVTLIFGHEDTED